MCLASTALSRGPMKRCQSYGGKREMLFRVNGLPRQPPPSPPRPPPEEIGRQGPVVSRFRINTCRWKNDKLPLSRSVPASVSIYSSSPRLLPPFSPLFLSFCLTDLFPLFAPALSLLCLVLPDGYTWWLLTAMAYCRMHKKQRRRHHKNKKSRRFSRAWARLSPPCSPCACRACAARGCPRTCPPSPSPSRSPWESTRDPARTTSGCKVSKLSIYLSPSLPPYLSLPPLSLCLSLSLCVSLAVECPEGGAAEDT